MYRSLLLVGIGSCTGGVCRFLTQTAVQRRFPSPIPLGTLVVNISGCLIIGVLYALAEKGGLLSADMRTLLATGFCGGFTTFSSFAFENVSLLTDAEWFYFILYIGLSIVLGVLAAYFGAFLIRTL
jgi:fluoride exporter